MGTYTVVKGDTLSGIARKLGLGSYNQLTGYRSGNPNLIYPGEVLSYGGGSPAPAPAPAPAGPSAADVAAQQAASYQQQADQVYSELGSFDQNAKSAIDIYNSALESLGISDARTRVSDLKQQLVNTENLLRSVEGDVTGRTQNSLVTEAQRNRLVAMEQAPIAENLRVQGQNYDVAASDLAGLTEEGRYQAGLEIQDQISKRERIIDRLEIARDNARTAEEKRRWETEIQIQRDKLAEEKRQFELEYALKKAEAAKASRGGGGSKSGGSGGISQSQAKQEFLDYIAGKWNSVGGAGKYGASRQTQDAWANAWFASKGITNPKDRQFYWDAFNSAYSRPENPYDDWLYKR